MNRVHWLSPGDPSQRTGGYLYNSRIADALRIRGVDVIVHPLEGPWPWPGQSHAAWLDEVPDDAIVVADGLLWPGLQAEERASLCRRCQVWVVIHSLLDKEDVSDQTLIEREMMALKEANGWFATSERTARLVTERINAQHSAVVIPGTEGRAHEPRSRGPVLRMLNVAHLIPRKGHSMLFEALSSLKDLDWSLDVVGSRERDAGWAAQIESEVSSLGLGERVKFRGELGAEDMEEAYLSADVLVHTASFEAYGMVLTEALARGLGVISTPAGALDGLDCADVQRVDSGDVVGLCEALRKAIEAHPSPPISPPRFPSWDEQAGRLMQILGLEEEGFSVDWLRMREPHDHAARSSKLVHAFSAALCEGPNVVMELATGLGSGARFVSAQLQQPPEWILVDHDPRLLAALATDMQQQGVRYSTLQHDLRDIQSLRAAVSGVTTQALLDLVSTDWLTAFADWLAELRVPFLGALTVNGEVTWSPKDPRDESVQHAFRTHQTWDRGFGASPGPRAALVLQSLLEERGFQVSLEASDWVIPATDQPMVAAMVEGTAAAAREAATDAGISHSDVDAWRTARLAQVGDLSIRVGHWDLLALP